MLKELTILVVGEHLREILDEIKKINTIALKAEPVAPPTLKDVLNRIHPELVIFEAGTDFEPIRKMANIVSIAAPQAFWAVTSKEASIDSVLHFFRMGAVDFLKQPICAEEIKKLIQKIIHLSSNHKNDQKEDAHHAFALFSTKGGVGLTSLASNLAVELAAKNSGKVLLLDLVLQHGNVADFLDVPPQFTLMDMLENLDRVDSNLLENSLAKHNSGVYVLPCPKQPEDGDFINSNQTAEIFEFLKGIFRYIVADVGHEFTKTSISFLDFSDNIFVVSTPDVPSLCNARNALGVLNRMGYGSDKVKMVLNHWRMKGEINPDEIRKNLGVDIFAQIPDDPMNCLIAANQGKPLLQVAPKSEFLKGVRSFLSAIENLQKKEVTHVASRAA